jgi:hypothetical protein
MLTYRDLLELKSKRKSNKYAFKKELISLRLQSNIIKSSSFALGGNHLKKKYNIKVNYILNTLPGVS